MSKIKLNLEEKVAHINNGIRLNGEFVSIRSKKKKNQVWKHLI